MKGQGGGGTARGGGKNRSGGGAVKVTKAKARETKAIEDNILKLRASIFDTNGRDKNVTLGIAPAFMKYERNGLDLSIEFATKLNNEEADWAFDLVKESMEERYDASGYGWDDEDKERELTENGARFLIVREWPENDKVKGDLVAFAHFRFTVQGEVVDQMAGEPQLLIFDLHVEGHSQRKGLGKHLLIVLELIARREKMSFISIPVQLGDNVTKSWLEKSGRGFSVDPLTNISGFDAEVEGFEVYSKSLEPPKPKPVEPVPTATATATAATEKAVEGPVGESKVSSEDNNKAPSSGNVFNFSSLTATLTEPSSGSEETSAETSSGVENEEEVISQLTVLFAEKHGRQPTPDEVALWVDSIRSIDTNDIPTNNTTTEGEDKEDGDGDNANDNSNSNSSSKALPVEDDWVHV